MKDIKVIFGKTLSGKSILAENMALAFENTKRIDASKMHEFNKGLSFLKSIDENIASIHVSEVRVDNIKEVIEHFFYDRSDLQKGFLDKAIVIIELQSDSDQFLSDLSFRLYERCEFIETTNVNGVFKAEKLQFEVNRIN